MNSLAASGEGFLQAQMNSLPASGEGRGGAASSLLAILEGLKSCIDQRTSAGLGPSGQGAEVIGAIDQVEDVGYGESFAICRRGLSCKFVKSRSHFRGEILALERFAD